MCVKRIQRSRPDKKEDTGQRERNEEGKKEGDTFWNERLERRENNLLG